MDQRKRLDSFEEGDEVDGRYTPVNSQSQWILKAHIKIGFGGEWENSLVEIEGDQLTANIDPLKSPEETMNNKKMKKCEVITDDERIKNLDPPWPYTSIVIIEYIDRSLYIMPDGGLRDCNIIEMWVKGAASANKNELVEQQLTMEDIPVIVDKCLKFITTQGCLSEGIYRIAGVNNRIITLLEEFRRNAWAVYLNPSQYSEHDVANTLKRFFRTLDNPLLTKDLRQLWLESSNIDDLHHKLHLYKQLLSELPQINYLTLRRLVVHLRTVSEQKSHNLMPVSNLATLWGPTILTTDRMTGINFNDCTSEAKVISDLIENFYALFEINDEEMNKEKELLDVLMNERLGNEEHLPSSLLQRSGDIKVWIHIESINEGEHVCLVIYPKMTVREATTKVWTQLDMEYIITHSLHEIVLKDKLERPMHYNEILMDSILKWSTWPNEDRKNTFLVLKPIREEFSESLKYVNMSQTFSAEVNYSPNAKKSMDIMSIGRNKTNFERCRVEVKGGFIVLFKNASEKGRWRIAGSHSNAPYSTTPGRTLMNKRKSTSMLMLSNPFYMESNTNGLQAKNDGDDYEEIARWPLRKIIWYYGIETKRAASSSKHYITFIEKDREILRSRSHPYFGEAISFENSSTLIKFISALIQADHGDDKQKSARDLGVPLAEKPSIHDPEIDDPSDTTLGSQVSLEICDGLSQLTDVSKDEADGLATNHGKQEDTSIDRVLKKLSIDDEEKHSLKQLLHSLSTEKFMIDHRIASEKYNDIHLERRSSSVSF